MDLCAFKIRQSSIFSEFTMHSSFLVNVSHFDSLVVGILFPSYLFLFACIISFVYFLLSFPGVELKLPFCYFYIFVYEFSRLGQKSVGSMFDK